MESDSANLLTNHADQLKSFHVKSLKNASLKGTFQCTKSPEYIANEIKIADHEKESKLIRSSLLARNSWHIRLLYAATILIGLISFTILLASRFSIANVKMFNLAYI